MSDLLGNLKNMSALNFLTFGKQHTHRDILNILYIFQKSFTGNCGTLKAENHCSNPIPLILQMVTWGPDRLLACPRSHTWLKTESRLELKPPDFWPRVFILTLASCPTDCFLNFYYYSLLIHMKM